MDAGKPEDNHEAKKFQAPTQFWFFRDAPYDIQRSIYANNWTDADPPHVKQPKKRKTIFIPLNCTPGEIEQIGMKYARPQLKGGDSFELDGIIYTVIEEVD